MNTFVNELLKMPAISRLGLTLAYTFWEGAIAAGLLCATLLAMSRASAGIRYRASCVGMAIVLLAAVFTLGFLPVQQPQIASSVMPSSPGEFTRHDQSTLAESSEKVPTAPAKASVVQRQNRSIDPLKILPFLAIIWAVGVVLLGLFRVIGWVVVQRRVAAEMTPLDQDWIDRLESLQQTAKVRRTIRWVQSEHGQVPFVVGWLRPTIVVPVAAQVALSTQQLEAVLRHELAHVNRGDYAVNLFQTAVETLLFHHPAVMWMSKQIRIEREHCCDDQAAAMTGSVTAYARALADLEATRQGGGVAMAATGTSLLPRLRRLLGQDERISPLNRWLVAGLAVAILSVPFGSVHLSVAATPVTAPATTQPLVDAQLVPYVPPTTDLTTKLMVGGSGTMGRIAEPLVAKFDLLNPSVYHEMRLQGSHWVSGELGTPTCNVGLMSRQMNADEHKQFRDRMGHDPIEILIAGDAILILVNKDNPTAGITLPQLDALYGTNRLAGYKGDVATWGDLGAAGDWAKEPVNVYGLLEQNQGTVETFRRIVLKGGPIDTTIHNIKVPENEFGQSVTKDRGGISYNIYHPPVDGAKELGIATEAGKPFIKATTETIADGTYPLTRGLYVYISDNQDPVANEFVKFVLSGEGQAIIAGTGQAVSVAAKTALSELKNAQIP